jgi:hypothetical protein
MPRDALGTFYALLERRYQSNACMASTGVDSMRLTRQKAPWQQQHVLLGQ